jgi:hypothetical protein
MGIHLLAAQSAFTDNQAQQHIVLQMTAAARTIATLMPRVSCSDRLFVSPPAFLSPSLCLFVSLLSLSSLRLASSWFAFSDMCV